MLKNNTSILNTQRAFCGLSMVLSAFDYASKNTEAQGILFSLKVKVGFKIVCSKFGIFFSLSYSSPAFKQSNQPKQKISLKRHQIIWR